MFRSLCKKWMAYMWVVTESNTGTASEAVSTEIFSTEFWWQSPTDRIAEGSETQATYTSLRQPISTASSPRLTSRCRSVVVVRATSAYSLQTRLTIASWRASRHLKVRERANRRVGSELSALSERSERSIVQKHAPCPDKAFAPVVGRVYCFLS